MQALYGNVIIMAETAISNVLRKYGFDFELKEEQRTVIIDILEKNDVFALLPTGFGKSMTYTLVPLVADEVGTCTCLHCYCIVAQSILLYKFIEIRHCITD